MSLWTYVNAEFPVVENPDDVFGKSCTWEEIVESLEGDEVLCKELEEHPERFMPSGSEGTLHRDVLNGNIVIRGSLRDYENVGEVAEWFMQAALKCGGGRCTIESDLRGKATMAFEPRSW